MKGADECDERSLSLLFQKNYCYYLAQQSVNRLSKREKKKRGKKRSFFLVISVNDSILAGFTTAAAAA